MDAGFNHGLCSKEQDCPCLTLPHCSLPTLTSFPPQQQAQVKNRVGEWWRIKFPETEVTRLGNDCKTIDVRRDNYNYAIQTITRKIETTCPDEAVFFHDDVCGMTAGKKKEKHNS